MKNKPALLIGGGIAALVILSFILDKGIDSGKKSDEAAETGSGLNLNQPAQPPAPSSQEPAPQPKTMQWDKPPATAIDAKKTYFATLDTSAGTMKIELFVKETPVTVNNFVFLARQGFYNGTTFHRIIKGFMIQGGDPKGDGTGGPGYRFQNEPVKRKYDRGIIAMANAGPDTNGSQFFIMHQNYALPPNYTIFGKVVEGFDALDKIANTPVTASPSGESSVPTVRTTVNSVVIEEK